MSKTCPWFRDGYCISPLLQHPDNTITSSRRCQGLYTTCRYFVDPADPPTERKTFRITEMVKRMQHIYALDAVPERACEFALFINAGKYYTFCNVIKRYLPVSVAKLCITQYQKCPFREYMPT